LLNKAAIKLEQLGGEAWIQTSASSPCARHVVRSCRDAGFEPSVSFESDDYQTVLGLVAAGVGVALIPELALTSQRDDVVIRELSPRGPSRRVLAAVPRGPASLPAASEMIEVLRQTAGRFPLTPLAKSA